MSRGLPTQTIGRNGGLQDLTFAELERILSQPRLDGYRRGGVDEKTVVARYLWNLALAEALHPSLHIMEVAFRNALDRSVANHLGDPNWLVNNASDSPASTLLPERSREAVTAAHENLAKAKKPIEQGRMVAELSFGFWTSLLNRGYERRLWPAQLGNTFPGHPAANRTRSTFSKRFNEIRNLRNRVSHHEPIWYRATLASDHAAIVEACRWIEPGTEPLLAEVDRFEAVLANRPA